MKYFIFCLLLCVLSSSCTARDEFSKGENAYLEGDYISAMQLLAPLAESGHGGAMFYVGQMYEQGRGVEVNYPEALKWYRRAAAKGVDAAQNNLGLMYREGLGVRRDYRQAAEWFRKAAMQGNDDAQLSLGALYVNGQGVQRDFAEAYAWYTLSAEQGNQQADRNLQQLERRMQPQDLDRAGERTARLLQQIEEFHAYGDLDNDISTTSWVTHKASKAFTVRHPKTWKVEFDSKQGKVFIRGQNGELVVIWPFFVQQRLQQNSAPHILSRFAQELRPDQRWGQPRFLGANTLRMDSYAGNQVSVGNLSWISTARGTAGCFCLITAQEHQFRQHEETFARIIQSFRALGATTRRTDSGARRQPQLQYTRWYDPMENAFELQVPQGWQVSGGMMRYSALDLRPTVSVNSPDRQIYIFIGDEQIPVHTTPSAILMQYGLTEGSWYPVGGDNFLVRQYTPGIHFGREWLYGKFGATVSNFALARVRERPEVSQRISAIYQRYLPPTMRMQFDIGELEFSGSSNNQPVRGYLFIGTDLEQNQYGGIGVNFWRVMFLYGYLATPDRQPEAAEALAHMVATLRMNPQWVRAQQNVMREIVKINRETNKFIMNEIQKTYRSQSNMIAEMQRQHINYISDRVDVQDPTTGRVYNVERGSQFFWIDPNGNIEGTDVDSNPFFEDLTVMRQKMIRLY
jgi:tetratricopeptide (TPR) repeat protein